MNKFFSVGGRAKSEESEVVGLYFNQSSENSSEEEFLAVRNSGRSKAPWNQADLGLKSGCHLLVK